MICWEPSQLSRILRPDAESIQDHVFNAVHCPTLLKAKESVNFPLKEIKPDDFVDKFLRVDRENSLAVVLGDSGSGKSHLIQWLRLRVLERNQKDKKTLLITVPRTGTSLRGILELLIECLPADEQEEYKKQLVGSGAQVLTDAAKVDRFLNALSHSLRHGANSREDLARNMADLLMDPTYRNALTSKKNGVVQLIARHIFESAKYRNTSEERREFRRDDILGFSSLYTRVSENAKNALDYIDLIDQDLVVGVLNSNLDQAIAETLNFTADNLIDLMNKIRRDLKRQNRRLIFLIEDFARLQGIDTALLQALITPNVQGADELCELRWAMAVTTGYFERFAETVQTRLSLIVDMNKSSPTGWPALTKGYLNALRLGEEKLRSDRVVVSACLSCPRRDSCFKAFGEIDGVGLFPFTETAIQVMIRRVSDRRLTPRTFLNDVLLRVLSSATTHDGTPFPSVDLLEEFPGENALGTTTQQELRINDPEFCDHRRALLELWDGTGQIVNLAPEIHEVFSIPLYKGNLNKAPKEPKGPKKPPFPPPPPPPPPEIDPDIRELEVWANNSYGSISQSLASRLRDLIYSSLESFIDWDRLGFKRASVAAAAGGAPFGRRSISFERQDLQIAASPVSILIKSNPENSTALQALLHIHRNKNDNPFSFLNSEKYLPTLFDFLTRIAEEVQVKLSEMYRDTPEWSYTRAAAEILLLTGLQAGQINSTIPIEETVAQMFNAQMPKSLTGLEQSLSDLNSALVRSWPVQQSLIRDISSGTKGGIAGNFLRIEPILRVINPHSDKSLRFSQTPPHPDQVPVQSLKDFVRLYHRVKDRYVDAVNMESLRWGEWGGQVVLELGEGGSFDTFKSSFEELMRLVTQKGIPAGNVVHTLTEMFKGMNMLDFDKAVKRALELPKSHGIASLEHIPFLVEQHSNIDQLIKSVNEFMSAVTTSVKQKRNQLNAVCGTGLSANQESIGDSLSQIHTTLSAILQLKRS